MAATIIRIDRFQRKMISVFYRVIIVFYSLFLLLQFEIELPILYYLVFILYIVIYYFLFRDYKFYSLLRLINDYTMIFFVIWLIKELNFLTISFIFIPILNSHNFSGNKKTILLYLIPFLGIYFLFRDSFDYRIGIAFLAFYLINFLGGLREKYLQFQQELNGVIDDFFVNNSEDKPSYLIYTGLIDIINNNNIFDDVKSIVCLHNKDGKISVANGSFFTWEIKVKNITEYKKSLKSKDKYANNIGVYLNNELIEKNIVINCKMSDCFYSYIFVVENNQSIVDTIKSKFFCQLMLPVLKRYSKVLKTQYDHNNNTISQLNVLQEKVNYVNNSVNSMHFIRNKLGPLKNYLAMVTDYESKGPELKKKIEPYIIKEREKLKSSIGSIIDRAEYVLTKSNNPFNVYELKEYGLQKLFSEIINIWGYHFNYENIKLKWNVRSKIKYNVKYNSTGLVLVVSNWVSNMKKYNSGKFGVILEENEEYYIVKFYNSIIDSENSFKFIDEYNSSGRDEISRRSSHGLLELKNFLSQMSLKTEMKKNDINVEFSIMFKKYAYNESTNN